MACVVQVGYQFLLQMGKRVEELKKRTSSQCGLYRLHRIFWKCYLFHFLIFLLVFSWTFCDVFHSHESRFRLPLGMCILYSLGDREQRKAASLLLCYWLSCPSAAFCAYFRTFFLPLYHFRCCLECLIYRDLSHFLPVLNIIRLPWNVVWTWAARNLCCLFCRALIKRVASFSKGSL